MDELEKFDQELEALAEQQRSSRSTPLPATFVVEATHDEAKSKDEGRPVYVDTEIVEIRVGSDTIRRTVTDADKRTYAAQYLAWKKGENQDEVVGFPLSQWAAIPGKALVKEFAHFGIRSVEQLAVATDDTLRRIGPHLGLREKARDWVADAQKKAPLLKVRDENEALKARVAALERMVEQQSKDIAAARQNGGSLPTAPAAPAGPNPEIEAMKAQLAALAAAVQPKKRGRPPKAKPETQEA